MTTLSPLRLSSIAADRPMTERQPQSLCMLTSSSYYNDVDHIDRLDRGSMSKVD